jgi:teichoic acid transport system permease protein
MVFEVKILPFVRVLSAFFVHLVFLVILTVVMILYGLIPGVHLLPFLYYVFCLLCLSISLAVFTSVIMPFFRDLTQIISVITTLGFWITPIAWSYKDMAIPGAVLTILKLNPMFYVVQGYRDALLSAEFTWQSFGMNLYFWLFVGIVLSIGIVAYRRLRLHLSDVI